MKLKTARPVYDLDRWFGRRNSYHREKALTQDEEHKPYIRGGRTKTHLCDSWDIKPIQILKSWKHRCRKRKQWMKHKIGLFEYRQIHDNEHPEAYILWKYSTSYWVEVEWDDMKTVTRLVDEGKLEGSQHLTWFLRREKTYKFARKKA